MPKHGTVSTYKRHKCRCLACKAAVATAARKYRAELKPRLADSKVVHGTWGTFANAGCRSDARITAAAAHKEAKLRTILPLGDMRHGNSGYLNYGCRCAVCTKAHTAQVQAYRNAHPEWYRTYRHLRRVTSLRESYS